MDVFLSLLLKRYCVYILMFTTTNPLESLESREINIDIFFDFDFFSSVLTTEN